ncbi:MAG: hypothetical protein ABSG75_11030 [Syntrophales bacterium]|jgi:hypothetical protein
MTDEERLILKDVSNKVDLLLACFGLDGKKRPTPGELKDYAKGEVAKYHERKKLKSSSGMGKVLSIKRKGDGKDECETGQG